jgi:hypothetical protein
MKAMDVELLVMADCPHESEAADLLRRALDDTGLSSTRFDTRVIRDLSEAQQAGFVGSPTILINGADPFRLPGSQPALACRIYRCAGRKSPLPELRPLRRALQRATDPPER